MDEQQKTRFIILAISGVLLIGGVGGWLVFGSNKTDEIDENGMATNQVTPGATTTTAANPNNPTATPATTTPVDSNPPAGTAPVATTPANPPAGNASSNPPAANTNTAATTPPANAVPVAAKPPANPPAQATTPVSSPIAQKPAEPANQLIAANTANTNPPAVGDSNPVPVPQATAPVPANRFPATKREEASAEARQVAGRKDPMQPTLEHAQFPQWSKGVALASADEGSKAKDEGIKVPPPPPDVPASGTKEKLQPPPPPPPSGGETALGGIPGGVDPGMLPMPPEKPSVAQFLKLTAIVGNKAVLSVPANVRSMTKWPATICLGPGEKIEDANNAALSIVSVDADSVTIDEDGERQVKALPTIK
ncbi:MAG: hypothetical protein K2X77_26980 [Candidatus Obscuribacterales bacterium]|nr:hypothetical protein [Candidatus Obscuribacterales bacterium]